MVQHTYLGNYPDERQDDWTDECQGVTHDRDHWFITQKGVVWRVPIGERPDGITSRTASTASGARTIPVAGYDHFGDPDCHKGTLYIPLEGKRRVVPFVTVPRVPRIAAFRASDLQFLWSAPLPKQQKAGWCAINSKGVLLSSNSRVTPRQREGRRTAVSLPHRRVEPAVPGQGRPQGRTGNAGRPRQHAGRDVRRRPPPLHQLRLLRGSAPELGPPPVRPAKAATHHSIHERLGLLQLRVPSRWQHRRGARGPDVLGSGRPRRSRDPRDSSTRSCSTTTPTATTCTSSTIESRASDLNRRRLEPQRSKANVASRSYALNSSVAAVVCQRLRTRLKTSRCGPAVSGVAAAPASGTTSARRPSPL